MKFRLDSFILSTVAVAMCALATPRSGRAQSAPPPAEAAPAAGLRRLDPPAAPSPDDPDTDSSPPARGYSRTTVTVRENEGGSQRVVVFQNLHVRANERIGGQAVVVRGDLTVDGEVGSQAVVVMGNTYINGLVQGQVVTILGNVTLGPKARVDGQIVCTGRVEIDPSAYVGGQIVGNLFGPAFHGFVPALEAWFYNCFRWGRPLALGSHFGWLWGWTLVVLGLRVLVALVFPAGIRRCGDTLVLRPGLTILSVVFTILAIPALFFLLVATVIGIPVALFLPLAIVIAVAFGQTSLFALIGRRISRESLPPALAVLIGGVICILLYTVPFLGGLVWFVLSALGLGCAVTALFTCRVERPTLPVIGPSVPVPPVMSPAPMAFPAVAPAVTADPIMPSPVIPPPPPAAVPSPLVDIASLPRAGFWIRLLGLFIDMILVGTVVSALPHFARNAFEINTDHRGMHFTDQDGLLFMLPLYGVLLWKLKGTTIGGIICRLKVVRLDGRPVDWTTAVVRGLAGYLSFICLGLGFIWVAFDPERQSWHDKIAGTTVVRPPHGMSLI
jgi:uncharacterized RDD family membrane protein YckC/cytoskeletal protein CcmA (bactofilin family)